MNEAPLDEGVILDIGGGSAQLTRIPAGKYEGGVSLTLGALALTKQFIDKDPASDKQVARLNKEILQQLETIPWLSEVRGQRLVGLGGTIRNRRSKRCGRLDL